MCVESLLWRDGETSELEHAVCMQSECAVCGVCGVQCAACVVCSVPCAMCMGVQWVGVQCMGGPRRVATMFGCGRHVTRSGCSVCWQ